MVLRDIIFTFLFHLYNIKYQKVLLYVYTHNYLSHILKKYSYTRYHTLIQVFILNIITQKYEYIFYTKKNYKHHTFIQVCILNIITRIRVHFLI